MKTLNPECVRTSKDKIIALKDPKGGSSKARFLNPNRREVEEVIVDECAITEGVRCDFLLNIREINASYFVELKGSQIQKAFDQLSRSHKVLSQGLEKSVTWVVSSSKVPRLGPKIQRLKRLAKKEHHATLVIKNSPVVIHLA